jgi:hypothetical protein
MGILNYTTEVDTMKSVGQIQAILIAHRVENISTEYRDREPEAITFAITLDGNRIGFRLPCNYEGVLRAMKQDSKVPPRYCNPAQAKRVAWRIIKDWVEAQLAIVEAQQAEVAEVFFPYLIVDRSGQSAFRQFKEHNQKQLEAGNGGQQ